MRAQVKALRLSRRGGWTNPVIAEVIGYYVNVMGTHVVVGIDADGDIVSVPTAFVEVTA